MSEKVFKIDEIGQEAIDFLLYAYFGIDNRNIRNLAEEEFKKEVAKKCAQRAYLDLARTLTFNAELKKEKGEEAKRGIICRRKFSSLLCDFIVESIYQKIFANPKQFNSTHEKICKAIQSNAKSMSFKLREETKGNILIKGKQAESFSYGQAQKWLNMTLKYMWLLGLWDTEFKKLKDEKGCLDLHVPVDSYIIQAASGELKIESSNKPWSQWSKDADYVPFQREIAKKTSTYGGRIFWEKDAWIKYAEESKKEEMENLKTYDKNRIEPFRIYQEYIGGEENEVRDVKDLNNIYEEILDCKKP